ncbi:hypothetical protein AAZX31_08G329200 [Glycine max]|uniref:SNF2 domain-containing protein CLASSY 3 n=1 Tax=Glycine max TaxID=3847 RepID=UPI001B355E6D|nr:SNF2 domain-containing protein CLASSY 3 [Glycine max]KAH1054430.1 hypothetical protein GYH30_023279 [Glycine max]KRH46528.2 hypothetical protein GLYMA_08G339900v4 [Glycine max]
MLIFARCLLGGSWWTLEDKKEILRCGVFLIIVRRNRKEKGLFFVLVLLFEMNEYTGPARRTRSKGVEVRGGLIRSRKRRRVVDYDDDELVFVKELKGGGEGASAKIEKSMERGFEFLGESEDDGPFEVVEIDEDDDEAEEEVYGECEQKKKRVEVKVEEKDEGPEVLCYVAAEKVASFGGGDDDECGSRPENPVVMLCVSDDGGGQSEEDHGRDRSSVSSDDGFGSSSSSSSEDDDSSDDDFKVGVEDERADDEEDYSSIEEESESDDDSSCDDERGELYKKFVKERVRNLVSKSGSSGVSRRKGKGNRRMQVEEEEMVEKWNGADCASVTSSKSCTCKDETRQAEVIDDAAERGESVNAAADELFANQVPRPSLPLAARETVPLNGNCQKKKPVEAESAKEIDMLWNELDIALQETEAGDSTMLKKKRLPSGVRSVSPLPKRQEKMGDSAKVVMKEDDGNGDKNGLHEVLRMSNRSKNIGFKFFTECFWGKPDSDKDDPMELEEKDGVVVQGQTQPLACGVGIPLTWDFLKKNPVEKSEAEKELDMLWAEMEMLLRAGEIGIQVDEARAKEENPALQCKHDTIFNEEIGVYCRLCGWIATEIKYIMPPFVDSKRSGREAFPGAWKTSQFDGATFDDCGDDSGAAWSHNEGTVWDIISDIKKGLFPHQQEGFEFIWTSLAGTTNLAELKRVDPGTEGGCIISHAPGTGKTKLTMVFLQTYLQLFPKCLPVIIAPANILLTWEDELRKWNIGIPFHNLNNAELSGKENVINEFGYQELNKDAIRMLKLCSWYKEKSILLISYNLYEKLAGGKSEDDGEKEKKNRKIRKEKKRASIETAMGKVLRDYPGLLVLDEGHTPRNQRSCIWKVLSESRSQKRILLSGTPFQNNFLELFNIFCLMKPSFSDNIPQELKKFCQSKLIQERKASKDVSWESINSGNPADEKIKQLKLLMNPFVHVHKGSILQKNLLGLQDCVLILKPEILQQKILDSIECSQNGLNFEHKLALVSVHPSLFLNCSLSKKEESVIDMDQLKKCRLDSYEGVKTKFLMEFVNLCDAVDEKVLVFSQFIDTLILIKDQLESAFNWSEGREVLFMHGRVDQKQKQSLIHSFNDANSQAKVLLASIKASSEGINLVGASRVVLLDVVWNPSVERQAICRAYRLGQKKVVYTYHLLAQGTPECTKYCKQAEKNRLSELVFSNRNAESDKLKRSGVIEDKVLDAMVQHEKLKDIFGECLVQPKEGDQETLCP